MKKNNDEVRSRIRAAARKLIQTYGIKGWNMDMICEEANIAKDTLYRIIVNKELLIADVIEERLTNHKKKIETIISADEDFFSNINLLCEAFKDLLNEFGTPQLRSLFKEYPKIESSINSYTNQLNQDLAHYLNGGKESGLIKPDTDTLLIVKSLNYLILDLLNDDSIERVDDAVEKFLQYLVYGIKKDKE